MASGDYKVVIDLLNELKVDVAEMKRNILELQENNAQSAVEANEMYKTLNAKFDMFKNLEAQSRESIQQGATTTRSKLTRPKFFKMLFTEDRDKYLDVLYTQAEIDEAFKTKEVLAKKKEEDRIAKVSMILYTTHIRENFPEGRAGAFASLFDQATASK